MPHGLLRLLVSMRPSYGVEVLTPAILVCPENAGLYELFGRTVSTEVPVVDVSMAAGSGAVAGSFKSFLHDIAARVEIASIVKIFVVMILGIVNEIASHQSDLFKIEPVICVTLISQFF